MNFGADRKSQGGWRRRLSSAALALIAICSLATLSSAHEVRPAIATLLLGPSGEVELRVTMNLEAYLADIGPDHPDTNDAPNAAEYDRLRRSTPDALSARITEMRDTLSAGLHLRADDQDVPLTLATQDIPDVGDTGLARVSELVFKGTLPATTRHVNWSVDARVGDSVIRLRKAGTTTNLYSEYVARGQSSKDIPLNGIAEQSGWSIARNYVVIGYEHIVPEGLDHILFVIGLFLLSPRLKDLLLQITCFTVAHSVTLGLGMLGVISLPPSIVEPLIAASIVYVAVENLFTSRMSRWRPLVVFCFGLLHGLGFAGVLNEIGLQPAHFVVGLVSFNVGVELGQLTVVAACFAAVGFWFRSKTWYRAGITVPASLMVAAVGAYWFVERVI